MTVEDAGLRVVVSESFDIRACLRLPMASAAAEVRSRMVAVQKELDEVGIMSLLQRHEIVQGAGLGEIYEVLVDSENYDRAFELVGERK